MRPIASRILLLLAVVLQAAACFEYEATIHLNPNGSGKAEFAYRFPPGLLEQTDLQGRIPLTQKDVDARYRMRAGVTQYRAEFRDLPKFKEVRLYLDFDNVSSLSERGNTFTYTVEGPYKVFRVRIDRQAASAPSGQGNPNQAKLMRSVLDRYTIRYKIFLPDRIEISNAQKVEWNSAEWEIPLSVFLTKEKQIVVLEAKTRASAWERIRWRMSHLLG